MHHNKSQCLFVGRRRRFTEEMFTMSSTARSFTKRKLMLPPAYSCIAAVKLMLSLTGCSSMQETIRFGKQIVGFERGIPCLASPCCAVLCQTVLCHAEPAEVCWSHAIPCRAPPERNVPGQNRSQSRSQ